MTHDAIHGAVSSVSATSVSVKASDGYQPDLRRQRGHQGARAGHLEHWEASRPGRLDRDVKPGDNVLVSGIKSGSTVTAKHVLDGR